MALLNSQAREETREILKEMNDPVKIILFTKKQNCMYCDETKSLLEEIKPLSDKLDLEVYDFDFSREKAEFYNIDKTPAIVLENKQDYGIRYYGIPSGYEYGSLLQDIIYVSRLETDLSQKTKDFLKKINKPIHLQVFVTPTCPYCPRAVLLAHQLALESKWISADMIEATEFPELSNKYRVYGVPKTVINEKIHIEGAVPEPHFLKELAKVL